MTASAVPSKAFTRYASTEEWICQECGQSRPFSDFTVRHWGYVLTYQCDCGVKWLMQRGNVRRLLEVTSQPVFTHFLDRIFGR